MSTGAEEDERDNLNPTQIDSSGDEKNEDHGNERERHMSIWKVSLELPIFLEAFSWYAAYGAGQNTQLLLWKVCNVVLSYNKTVCANLNNHTHLEETVQRGANTFSISDDLLNTWPPLVAAFIAGSISDRFNKNRRWLICFPVLGGIVSVLFQALHYKFIWQVPLQFFYLDNFVSYFGGWEMYFMGLMAYGADISRPEDTAHRLARYDAMSRIGRLLGTLASPHIFEAAGYYGCYLTRFVFEVCTLISFIMTTKTFNGQRILGPIGYPLGSYKAKLTSLFKSVVIGPVRDMWHVYKQPRQKSRRFLLHAGLFIYFLCITGYQRNILNYLYLDKVYADFSLSKFATITAAEQGVGILSLLIFSPILTSCFHETVVLLIVSLTITLALTSSAFVTSLMPGFLAMSALAAVDNCNWSLVNTLLSKAVKHDEIGKVFAMTSIMMCLCNFFMKPVFRTLYNATLVTFPGAFILLSASLYAVICVMCSVLFAMRGNFRNRNQDDEEQGPNGSIVAT